MLGESWPLITTSRTVRRLKSTKAIKDYRSIDDLKRNRGTMHYPAVRFFPPSVLQWSVNSPKHRKLSHVVICIDKRQEVPIGSNRCNGNFHGWPLFNQSNIDPAGQINYRQLEVQKRQRSQVLVLETDTVALLSVWSPENIWKNKAVKKCFIKN